MLTRLKHLLPPRAVSWYHLAIAWCGAVRYGHPSRRLTLIGITGTNGKSTVVWMLARMLEAAGHRVAASSSIEFQIAEKHEPNMKKMTMPGRWFLQKFLATAVRSGCSHAVIEATSEGILQHRHRFLDWDVALMLNISPEHIERHGSFEAYRAAKGELFRALGNARKIGREPMRTSIVNSGDKEAAYFLRYPSARSVAFRVEGRAAAPLPRAVEEIVAEHVNAGAEGIRFSIRGVAFRAPLLGIFNIENALAATAAATAVGVPLETCAAALRSIAAIPGRLEEVPNDRGIRIFVDYAHTPVALAHVYQTIASSLAMSKRNAVYLTCVLGAAGGGRDKWKRVELGKIAAEACDHIIITDEDPYDEDAETIRSMILGSVRAHGGAARAEEVPDRRLAIRRAIAAAAPGGAVIITGKGCEPWMMLAGGKKIAWDDRAIAREEAEELSKRERLEKE